MKWLRFILNSIYVFLIGCGFVSLYFSYQDAHAQQPLVCPPKFWIIATGISENMTQNISSGNWYGGFQSNNAGTSEKWTFVMGPIPADSGQIAFQMMNHTLPTIQLVSGPIHVNLNQWECIYHVDANFTSVAYTPPLGCETCTSCT